MRITFGLNLELCSLSFMLSRRKGKMTMSIILLPLWIIGFPVSRNALLFHVHTYRHTCICECKHTNGHRHTGVLTINMLAFVLDKGVARKFLPRGDINNIYPFLIRFHGKSKVQFPQSFHLVYCIYVWACLRGIRVTPKKQHPEGLTQHGWWLSQRHVDGWNLFPLTPTSLHIVVPGCE